MWAPLTSCMPAGHQNNADPIICTSFGILFPSVPAWHRSPSLVLLGAYVSLTVPSSAAQHPKGMVLICGTQKQCVCKNPACCRLASDLLFRASLKLSCSFVCAFAYNTCYLFQPVLLLLLRYSCLPVSGWNYLGGKNFIRIHVLRKGR